MAQLQTRKEKRQNMVLSKDISELLSTARALLDRRVTIVDKIASFKAGVSEAEKKLRSAQSVLSIEASAAALDSSKAVAPTTRKAVAAARERREELEAAIVGLQERLQQSNTELEGVLAELSVRRNKFVDDWLAAYTQEHLAAAETFVRVLRKGLAIGSSLGLRGDFLSGLSETRLCSPTSPFGVAVETVERRYNETRGWYEVQPTHPEADAISVLWDTIRELEKITASSLVAA